MKTRIIIVGTIIFGAKELPEVMLGKTIRKRLHHMSLYSPTSLSISKVNVQKLSNITVCA
jgi:mttA/Hcf106 family